MQVICRRCISSGIVGNILNELCFKHSSRWLLILDVINLVLCNGFCFRSNATANAITNMPHDSESSRCCEIEKDIGVLGFSVKDL